jgi:hypothetical protein
VQTVEPLEQAARPLARAFPLDRGSSTNPEGDSTQRECRCEGEQRLGAGVALRARAGDRDADGDEKRAGQELRRDKAGAEPECLQPSGLSHGDRRREGERAKACEERVQKHLNRGVEHSRG